MDSIDQFKIAAKVAKALGDRTRLLIFREIADRGTMNMSEAIQLTNLAQPSVSFHIKQLVNAELVDSEKVGREVHLTVNRERVTQFFSELDQIKGAQSL
jgi:ArsR family transcriptional regulator, arsenate/arsenite/antimonite-responsive transcriptional repressor